jgi:hypothetical protein
MDPLRKEDPIAKWCRENGVARVDGVLRDTRFLPHPRLGGARGYDIPFRQMIVDAYQAGNPAPEGMRASVYQWMQNVNPKRMTGNKAILELSGEYLLLLVIFKLIWPQANYFECIAFIANQTEDGKKFMEGDIGKALRRLGYTMKVTSTVAYQAFTERNLTRRRLFWTMPWPIGIHGIPRRLLIDADEFGLNLNDANRKYGSAPWGLQIH